MRPVHASALISTATAILLFASPASAATMVVNVSGANAAAIQSDVEAFRDALGPNDTGNQPINSPGSRRQINWDAAPDAISDPNAFPGDFFNFGAAPRARGIEFSPLGTTTGFQLSSTAASGEPIKFDNANDFVAFSEERLFTPIDGTTFLVEFFNPADQTTPAATRGLGVVFTDVEVAGSTTMQFFDIDGNPIEIDALGTTELEVVVGPNSSGGATGDRASGLSFAGVIFDDPIIASVIIKSGDGVFSGSGSFAGGDGVVMDDFIYGEPSPIPLPAPILMLLGGLAALGVAARRRA